ncbi:MAG: ABC transporter ATP-binding protein [Candidatus Sungbacteria bacterium]|nr:ABC transporter ATP-binding protein [bacterium]MDZ4285604.1 ABC transporter ATP-binding protein [Candidatus Sungbacteria bacterium]
MNGKGDPNTYMLFIESLYKAYGKNMVLDNIDLQVRAGELVTVVGPSGCGKSTLLRIILGEDRASSGTILIDGKAVGFPDVTRGIVYQKYTLIPNLTALENISFGKEMQAGLFGKKEVKKQMREEARYFLEQVNLGEHANQYPHQLSGGQQQRVAIAQALIMKPKILLMDEPFGALDPATREHQQVFLIDLWQRYAMTIFFITHDLDEAVFLGTRVLALSPYYRDGRGEHVPHGAKIIVDQKLEWPTRTTAIKETAEFGKRKQSIRAALYKESHRAFVTQFNLSHPDAFQTLTDEEARQDV